MNALFEIIRREIGQCGVLPFARFMELALYCPKHGYYETNKDNPGRRGDFYTSVGTGEIFGRLLAFQFAEWLEGSVLSPQSRVHSPESTVQIVEAGAHDGKLAKDILAWLQTNRPELLGQIEYWILEPSIVRQEWQRETLKDFGPRVRWLSRLKDLSSMAGATEDATIQRPVLHGRGDGRFNGVFFSNELLDAMPVHRFGWDAKGKVWYERGVAVEGEKFVWGKIQAPDASPRMPDPGLLAVLPDGYTIETCPAAESWWREAANFLERGRLMTMDYGLTADELISPGRLNGTLRAYYRHQVSDDLLAKAGEQDITAHVNFSAIQAAGESAGLKTESIQTQSQFLTRILSKASQANSLGELVSPKSDGGGSEDGWTSAAARQFQTLTHPEHLGRAFRVLVQTRSR